MSSSAASEFWSGVNKYQDLVIEYERNINRKIIFYEDVGERVRWCYRKTSDYNGPNVQNL